MHLGTMFKGILCSGEHGACDPKSASVFQKCSSKFFSLVYMQLSETYIGSLRHVSLFD
jgi:hypothetical protein